MTTGRSTAGGPRAVLVFLAQQLVDDPDRSSCRDRRDPPRHQAVAARGPRRHGQGDRPAGPGGPVDPQRGARRRRQGRRRRHCRHRRLTDYRFSRWAGWPDRTGCAVRWSSSCGPTGWSGWRPAPGCRARPASSRCCGPARNGEVGWSAPGGWCLFVASRPARRPRPCGARCCAAPRCADADALWVHELIGTEVVELVRARLSGWSKPWSPIRPATCWCWRTER